MDPAKLVEMQLQMQRNNSDIQSFLTGLDSWTDDIKKTDESLKAQPSATETSNLPPVRNSLVEKKKKKKSKPKSIDGDKSKEPTRISGFDFRAWDKYDVDKAIADISGDEGGKMSSSGEETDEDWEIERRVQQANLFKDQGNMAFKQGNYDEAIEHYTRGIECDPENAILPANRAMALIKQQKFAAAEVDCTDSLLLDPMYVKAYSRRAMARIGLNHDEEALRDFNKVLTLEPKNKFAQTEKQKLEEKLNPSVAAESMELKPQAGIIQAIYKPPGKRSKKPLRRIQIEEIGADDGQTIQEAIAKTEASQGGTKHKVIEKVSEMFEKFVTSEPTTSAEIINTDLSMTEAAVATSTLASHTFSNPSDIILTSSASEQQKDTTTVQQLTPTECGETRLGHVPAEMPTSSARSLRLPDVPSSSFQFQADWKSLKNQPERFYHYFKRINPSQYVKLVGTALDADILNAVLRVLHDFYLPENANIYPVLQNMTAVKRFSMIVMFMSATEKQVLQPLFDAMRRSGRNSAEDLNYLSKKYGL